MKKLISAQALFVALSAIGAESSSELSSRFVLRGSVVLDKETGLSWQRCSVGLTWNEADQKCLGSHKKFTYYKAKTLDQPGKSKKAWRVPDIEELSTIIDMRQPEQKIYANVFPDTDAENNLFRTVIGNETPFTWYVDFKRGTLNTTFEDPSILNSEMNVRLVYARRERRPSGD